uniref:Small ribosomal subunit protein uS12m n=1 Tax=Macrostomum lignano TaxID=282301 RepID=A0A1I8JQA3_9PLAT
MPASAARRPAADSIGSASSHQNSLLVALQSLPVRFVSTIKRRFSNTDSLELFDETAVASQPVEHRVANLRGRRQPAEPHGPLRADHEEAAAQSAHGRPPFMKGVVLRTLIRKPKKPEFGQSAMRPSPPVQRSRDHGLRAWHRHNLQEHNMVLVRGGRCQDLIGVKHKVVRGKYDCAHVVKPVPK